MNLWHTIEEAAHSSEPPTEALRFESPAEVLRHLHQGSSTAPLGLMRADKAFEAPLRILAPIDFLEGTESSLAFVRVLSRLCPSRVVVLTIQPSRPPGETEEMVGEAIRALAVYVRNAGFEASEVELRVLESRPESSIFKILLEAAQDIDAHVTILASHGKGPLARVFVGSTTEALLKHASSPVLVLPTTHTG